MDRTIVFCRTYKDCSNLYLFFRSAMGKDFTNPIGLPDYLCFRLVDMFTACNTPTLKHSILKSFSDPNATLRIVIATIAFGYTGVLLQMLRVTYKRLVELVEMGKQYRPSYTFPSVTFLSHSWRKVWYLTVKIPVIVEEKFFLKTLIFYLRRNLLDNYVVTFVPFKQCLHNLQEGGREKRVTINNRLSLYSSQ